jgi:hypothetical protein
MVDNPTISLHVRHQQLYSHDENCTIAMGSSWRLCDINKKLQHSFFLGFSSTYSGPICISIASMFSVSILSTTFGLDITHFSDQIRNSKKFNGFNSYRQSDTHWVVL